MGEKNNLQPHLNKISLHNGTVRRKIPAFTFKSVFMTPAGYYSEKWKLVKHLVEIRIVSKRGDVIWMEWRLWKKRKVICKGGKAYCSAFMQIFVVLHFLFLTANKRHLETGATGLCRKCELVAVQSEIAWFKGCLLQLSALKEQTQTSKQERKNLHN